MNDDDYTNVVTDDLPKAPPRLWSSLSLLSKIAAIVISILAVGGAVFVFGYGRIWFRK